MRIAPWSLASTLALLAAAAPLTACQDKSKPAAPAAVVATGGAGSGKPAAPAGPRKSSGPLAEPALGRLAALTLPGYQAKVRSQTPSGFEVFHLATARPKLSVTVTILPCGDCPPMDVAKWREHTDQLKGLLSPVLRDRADTTFEVGAATIGDATAIYTYQLGQYLDAEGGSYSHAYVLYFNDGVNSIRVVAEYKDDPMASAEAMAEAHPRRELEALAAEQLGRYAQAW